MANTIIYSNAIVTLTVGSTTNIVQDDYITAPTGKTGIVIQRVNATTLRVAEMTTTAFAAGDVITAVQSGLTATIAVGGRALYTPTTFSPNVVLVSGVAGPTETKVFSAIAGVSGATGVTAPTIANQWLGLQQLIYIGYRGQSTETVAISENELVNMTLDTISTIRVIADGDFKSTLTFGKAKYREPDVTGTTYLINSSLELIDSGNGLYAAGFLTGDTVTISGFTDAGNNGTKSIKFLDSTTLGTMSFVDTAGMSVEAAGDTVSIIADVLFPPLYTRNGSKIKIDGIGTVPLNYLGLYVDSYSEVDFYDSSLISIDSGDGNAGGWEVYGTLRLCQCSILDNRYYGLVGENSKWYVYDTHRVNCGLQTDIYAYFAITNTGPQYMQRFFHYDSSAPFFALIVVWEAVVNNVFVYNNEGAALGILASSNLAATALHLVNSEFEVNLVPTSVSYFNILKESSFKLTVLDEAGNFVPDAKVELRDKNGILSFPTILTAKLTAAINVLTSPITVTLTPNNDELTVGDIIRIDAEQFRVLSISSTTEEASLERGVGSPISHHVTISNIYKMQVATTNSDGQINYDGFISPAVASTLATKNSATALQKTVLNPFTLKIYKDGYETYLFPIGIGGKAGYTIYIKLRHSPTPGRDEMGTAIN